VAFVEDAFVVTWVRRIDTWERRLMTRRVETSGTMPAVATAVTSWRSTATTFVTRVAAGTTGAMVTWNSGLKALPIDSAGVATGATTDLSGSPGSHDISFDGTNFLVAWDEGSGFPTEREIYSRLLDSAGVGGTKRVVSNAPANQMNATLAFVGGVHLAAFEDTRFSVGTLYAQDVGTDGVATTTGTIKNELLVASETPATHPELASDGSNALMVWEADGDIRAALVMR
jgi:hypothetical protein